MAIIEYITEEQVLTPKGKPITLDVNRNFLHVSRDKFAKILRKLQDELDCIEAVKWAEAPSISELHSMSTMNLLKT